MPDETIEDRVARGAALLDRVIGDSSWAGKIDLEALALDDPFKCVLGQVFGEYEEGAEAVGIPYVPADVDEWGIPFPDGTEWPDGAISTSLGFSIPYWSTDEEVDEAHAVWGQAIKSRREGSQP